MKISVDEVTHLGSFMEIEKFADEESFEKSKQDIFGLLQQLGVKETVKKDYLELLWEKGLFKKDG